MIKPDYSATAKRVAGFGYADMPRGFSKTSHYKKWISMLKRCYTTSPYQPTYEHCYVCDEWAYLSNFTLWMDQHDWEGKQLDKDLLGDGYKYSPENCCFISGKLNILIEPRGTPVDLSDHKREMVLGLMGRETDPRVVNALKERYKL